MKNRNLKLLASYCSFLTILFLTTQQISAEVIFKDNFNTVAGVEEVNFGYDNPGRQSGTMVPTNYFTTGGSSIGDGAAFPNWLNKANGALSPNINFTNLNNFVVEFDMIQPGTNDGWVSIVVGSDVQGAAGDDPVGGHGLLIHVNGAYVLREYDGTIVGSGPAGSIPVDTSTHITICVSTESYGGTDKPKISVFVDDVPLKVDNAINGYTRLSNCAYTNNHISFFDAGALGTVAFDNFTVSTPETIVLTKRWLDDADMELDSSRVYSHKINLNADTEVTINSGAGDVTFGYATNGQTSGTDWELGDLAGTWIFKDDNTVINHIALEGKKLTEHYFESNPDQSSYLKLTGLTPGNFGFLKLYGVSKWALPTLPQHRSNYFAVSFGGQVIIDQNEFNEGTGIIVKVEYTVPESGELTVALTPVEPRNRHRFKWTAFSNYQVIPEPFLFINCYLLFIIYYCRKLIPRH